MIPFVCLLTRPTLFEAQAKRKHASRNLYSRRNEPLKKHMWVSGSVPSTPPATLATGLRDKCAVPLAVFFGKKPFQRPPC